MGKSRHKARSCDVCGHRLDSGIQLDGKCTCGSCIRERIADLERQLERVEIAAKIGIEAMDKIYKEYDCLVGIAARLRETLEKYRQEYDTPCPDLTLRVVLRKQLWKLLDETEEALADDGRAGEI